MAARPGPSQIPEWTRPAPRTSCLTPTSPVDARVLYVAGFGDGVYKSSDGGKTWNLKNNGITQTEPFAGGWRALKMERFMS